MTTEDGQPLKLAVKQLQPRSSYWWSTAYEVGLAALIIAAGIVLTAIGQASNLEELAEIQWWKGVAFAVLVAVTNFIRAKLPERNDA